MLSPKRVTNVIFLVIKSSVLVTANIKSFVLTGPSCCLLSEVYPDQMSFKLIDSQHELCSKSLTSFPDGISTLAPAAAAEDGAAAPAADAPVDGKHKPSHGQYQGKL